MASFGSLSAGSFNNSSILRYADSLGTAASDQALFGGWCCHHDRKIAKLTFVCGDISVECAYGLRRKDVGEVFPDWVNSSESGFEALVDLQVGEWQVSLEAELETGEILSFQAPTILTVQPYDIWRRSADKFEELSSFIEAIRQRARERNSVSVELYRCLGK